MKTQRSLLVIAMLAAGLLGFGLEKFLAAQRHAQLASSQGQTLADLSRALESEKQKTGVYPESISGLPVPSESPEFSPAELMRVVYRKTAEGYVAFIGSPHSAYVTTGQGVRFE